MLHPQSLTLVLNVVTETVKNFIEYGVISLKADKTLKFDTEIWYQIWNPFPLRCCNENKLVFHLEPLLVKSVFVLGVLFLLFLQIWSHSHTVFFHYSRIVF